MKRFPPYPVRAALGTALGIALAATPLRAQDCKSHLYMTANAKLQLTLYDKKGKPSGTQTVTVTDVKQSGGTYLSTVTTALTDEKGKALGNGTGTYKCAGGLFSADMKMALPQESLNNMKASEMKMEPVYLDYPAAPAAGQKLADAEMKLNMTVNGGMAVAMTFRQTGRTVTGKETVTSPAGSWEAYVIGYEGTVQSQMAGISLPAFSFTVKEWYVPGMGIVKSETLGKNGKALGSTLLTSVTK